MTRLIAPVFASMVAIVASPLIAQDTSAEKADALFEALGLPDMLEIMHSEGVSYGATIAQDMLPDGETPRWSAMVNEIYDVEVMSAGIRADFYEALEGADLDAMLAFFSSDLGQKIVSLEVSAREAFLDKEVEEASKDIAAIAAIDKTERFQLITDYVVANDLIESNVIGTLNANYAFYTGLLDGGATQGGLSADVALQQVWAQEDAIRANTTEWVYAYLMLAYQPLEDADLEAYTAFATSDAGQDLNAALFNSFDDMFNGISRDLGLASSQFLISQEL